MGLEKEIARMALIGTQRSKLTPDIRQQLFNLGIPHDCPDEHAILAAASILSSTKKAKFQAEKFNPQQQVSIEGLGEVCSSKSIKHLYMIVSGAFEHALPEFLYNLSKNKKELPPEILPDLLDKSLTSPELWSRLRHSLGKRGEWLIQQNPDWVRLLKKEPNISNWENGTNDARVFILQQILQEDPAQTLELVQEAWDKESLNQRIRFMKVLGGSTLSEIEGFLEQQLDNRRKEIRKTAAEILAKMPDSALSQRVLERIKKLIVLKKRTLKKNKLIVELPEKLDDGMIRDGIDPRVQWFKGGVKASRLGQMVAILPSRLWTEYLGLSAAEILKLFVRSDWGELLVQAMVESATLHQDEEWTEALLSFKIESQNTQRWQSLNVSRLLANISDKVFNEVAIKGMKNTKGLLEENSPITQMLKTVPATWDDELTQLVMKNLQKWLQSETSRYWNGWHFRTILQKAAYTCNPFLHDKMTADWPDESRIWSSWEKEVEEFLSTLYFRKKMIDGLRSN